MTGASSIFSFIRAAACRAAKIPCIIVGSEAEGDWNVQKTDDILAVIK